MSPVVLEFKGLGRDELLGYVPFGALERGLRLVASAFDRTHLFFP
jgi:hypothetical protein